MNKELLQALKDMGAYSVAFGVDSGNQRVLDKVNKHITLAQIEHAGRGCVDAWSNVDPQHAATL